MRVKPDSESSLEELKNLNAEPWMLDLLSVNPSYPFWGNHEDYMMSGSRWDAPIELDSIDDMWELDDYNEVVHFYFNVVRESSECVSCEGSGYNHETNQLNDDWYGFDNPSKRWCNKLTQDEVDILWEKNRLTHDFKEKPTADEVNQFYSHGIGHDSINRYICVEYRAKRLGFFGLCEHCNGHGYAFTEPKAHVELQLWALVPRKGCSRGVLIKNINKEDIPKVFKLLDSARKRNETKFCKIDDLKKV